MPFELVAHELYAFDGQSFTKQLLIERGEDMEIREGGKRQTQHPSTCFHNSLPEGKHLNTFESIKSTLCSDQS